jgi:hypothetical protein
MIRQVYYCPKETRYTYYKDDLLHKREDGRRDEQDNDGAILTFTYNARHLVKTIVNTKPVTSAPEGPNSISAVHFGTNTTFSYDAAGNRLSMSESIGGTFSGSTTYVYNKISRMTSETRTMPEVSGSPFLLSYSYNLAGQLKTLGDPFTGVVTYAYNKVGELTGVTGTGFHATPSQLASNMQYRAWGALKHAEYGDGATLNLEYNSRLLMTSYNNFETYEYFDDGKIKKTLRPSQRAFARSYTYDQIGRLQQAKTGRAARGLGEDDEEKDPYNQTYDYDAFNNLKTRINRFWNHDADGFTATYVNNRNQDPTWVYDDAGNLKEDQTGAVMTYNTANQMSKWQKGQDYLEQSYDGDGLPAKRVEVRTSQPAFSSTIYYLRSTVLGGAVIADLNSSGLPVGTGLYRNVYANGVLLAREEKKFGVWQMNWQHVNPLTGDRVDGFVYRPTDPLGGYVGPSDPYIGNPKPTYEELVGPRPYFLEEGNPFNAGVGCTLDGLPVDCSSLQQRAGNETLSIIATAKGEKREAFYRAFFGEIYVETYGLSGKLDEEGDPIEGLRENFFFNLAGQDDWYRSILTPGVLWSNSTQAQRNRLVWVIQQILDDQDCLNWFNGHTSRLGVSANLPELIKNTPINWYGNGDWEKVSSRAYKHLLDVKGKSAPFNPAKFGKDDSFGQTLGRGASPEIVINRLSFNGFDNRGVAAEMLHELFHAAGLHGSDPYKSLFFRNNDLRPEVTWEEIEKNCAARIKD